MVAGEILNVILPLSVRIVRGLAKNVYPALPGMIVVCVDILDSHHDCTPQRDARALLDQDNRSAIAGIQLSAVIPHADAEGKSERVAQPIDSVADVWVGQFRNHNTTGHRSIRQHLRILATTRIARPAPGQGIGLLHPVPDQRHLEKS